jgi:hypothetical protein
MKLYFIDNKTKENKIIEVKILFFVLLLIIHSQNFF